MPLPAKLTSSASPARVFEAHYAFLLKWALHFADRDLSLAEDLVQETFVRFVVNQKEIVDPENAQPLVYGYLEKVHLKERSRYRRFQPLSTIEYDSVQLSLREQGATDPIEVQDELRSVLSYLCWRKEHAKSASILLLRFFHGYFPEEIMQICRLSRYSVDCRLSDAREEARRHLYNSTRVVPIDPKIPVAPSKKRLIAVQTDPFMAELSGILFGAKRSECLSEANLLAFYRQDGRRAVPHELLAHIVSCEECLNRIAKELKCPPASTRPPDEIVRFSKRPSRGEGSRKKTQTTAPRMVMEAARRRLRELQEHHPRTLMIVVNGTARGSQDVRAVVNTQRVEIENGERVHFIEVFSEQGLSLLALPINERVHELPPQLRHSVELSDQRTISLCMTVGVEGFEIEVTYHDPEYVDWTSEAIRRRYADEISDESDVSLSPMPARVRSRIPAGWRDAILNALPGAFELARNRQVVIAGVLSCIAVVLVSSYFKRERKPVPASINALLVRAEAWDARSQAGSPPGVIRQRVRISTSSQKVERLLYRDKLGIRHRKRREESPEAADLKARLQNAGVDWEEPLAAGSYQQWHDTLHERVDRFVHKNGGLLLLTTTTPSGAVSKQSLTVRESDFHPVERTVEFRESGTVEIAELDYTVLPWNKVDPGIFDGASESGIVLRPSLRMSSFVRIPLPPSASALDLSELQTRIVLEHLSAGEQERIEVQRAPSSILVKGIVATPARKQELEWELHKLLYVVSAIHTEDEMQRASASQAPVTGIRTDTDVEAETPLHRYLAAKHWTRDEISDASEELFHHSLAVQKQIRAIEDLLTRFGEQTGLTPEVRSALALLLQQHVATLQEEEQAGEVLLQHITPPETRVPPFEQSVGFQLSDLAASAEAERRLIYALIVTPESEIQDTGTILADLSRVAKTIQIATSNGLVPSLEQQGFVSTLSTKEKE